MATKKYSTTAQVVRKNRVSELPEESIITITNNAARLLLKELPKYTSPENVKLFKLGDTPLAQIGICEGITTLIDPVLQTYNKHLCILSTDTLKKFKQDIKRDF